MTHSVNVGAETLVQVVNFGRKIKFNFLRNEIVLMKLYVNIDCTAK